MKKNGALSKATTNPIHLGLSQRTDEQRKNNMKILQANTVRLYCSHRMRDTATSMPLYVLTFFRLRLQKARVKTQNLICVSRYKYERFVSNRSTKRDAYLLMRTALNYALYLYLFGFSPAIKWQITIILSWAMLYFRSEIHIEWLFAFRCLLVS